MVAGSSTVRPHESVNWRVAAADADALALSALADAADAEAEAADALAEAALADAEAALLDDELVQPASRSTAAHKTTTSAVMPAARALD